MIQDLRKKFNATFTQEQYDALLENVTKAYNHRPNFRVCETPIFIPSSIKKQLFSACEQIIDTICQTDFKQKTQGAILPHQFVPNETEHTEFLVLDFGICEDGKGGYVPQLIELQGFPSLYCFQHAVAKAYRQTYEVPEHFDHLFGGLNEESYMEVLRRVIVGDTNPENVVLLEVEPHKQGTQIDFWATQHHLGIKVLCITEVIQQGKRLFYKNEQGELVRIEKIYNRIIFDELQQKTDLKFGFDFRDELDVIWVGHPHWFFRISKYTMPFMKSDFIPETRFLSEVTELPENLEDYVLKPLYSFAGKGILIHVQKADIEAITDRENYILQKKVKYADCIETPTGPAKFEIRMLAVWEKGTPRPLIINNLIRVSKGEMVGVRYNRDKDWVGGSVAFFEP